ncbi:hypothetical protein BC567DRAFT_92568 [Phyllosticta citribraziliensis]
MPSACVCATPLSSAGALLPREGRLQREDLRMESRDTEGDKSARDKKLWGWLGLDEPPATRRHNWASGRQCGVFRNEPALPVEQTHRTPSSWLGRPAGSRQPRPAWLHRLAFCRRAGSRSISNTHRAPICPNPQKWLPHRKGTPACCSCPSHSPSIAAIRCAR